MGATNAHKNPQFSKRTKGVDWSGEKTRALVEARINNRLDDADSFNGPDLIDEVADKLTIDLLKRRELMQVHLYQMVKAYVGNMLYGMLSGDRPAAGSWQNALQTVFDGDYENSWYEHENGTYTKIDSMDLEQIDALVEERERRIRGQMEAVNELRDAADNARREGRTKLTIKKTDEKPVKEDAVLPQILSHYTTEFTGFCWYCGRNTMPEERCETCDVTWTRAYANECPTCGGSFVHLNAPALAADAEREGEEMIRTASGSAWCDACGFPWTYLWTHTNDTEDQPDKPALKLVGVDQQGVTRHLVKEAREIVSHDS